MGWFGGAIACVAGALQRLYFVLARRRNGKRTSRACRKTGADRAALLADARYTRARIARHDSRSARISGNKTGSRGARSTVATNPGLPEKVPLFLFDSQFLAAVRLGKINHGTERDNAGRVNFRVRHVIMAFDVIEVHGVSDP